MIKRRSAPILLACLAACLLAGGGPAWGAPASSPPAAAGSAVEARFEASETLWEGAFNAFEEEDRAHAPPSGGVVFVGSSSIRLWNGLEHEFSAAPIVLKRGFGGSTLSDCVHYLDRLVIRYRPRLVLVYAGDNDLAQGRTPEEVERRFQAFTQGIHQALPETRIAFIAVKPSPARARLLPKARRANALVREYASHDARLVFIDVFTPMLDERGQPRPELFAADALHLNEQGYELWRKLIRPHLR